MTDTYDTQNIFARILRGELPAFKVFEDDVALAFMDIMPRTEGHTLVIPKVAARTFLDLPREVVGPYMERVQKLAVAVKAGMGAEGLTIQQFNEAAGGQEVFHLHVHLLPRWSGIPIKPPGTMGDKSVIAAHAEKIKAAVAGG